MMELSRPVLRWHGGKWNLAEWIIAQFPPHRVYVEPFGGAASVLLCKPPAYAEVYNDLDGDVVNLFRVLRDGELGPQLVNAVRLTPFSRDEFNGAYKITDDPLERARRLIIRSYMGFGSNGHNIKTRTGFRSNSSRSGTTPAHDWANYPDRMLPIIDRLRGVVIENKDAVQLMIQHDGADTLFYVDPPYLPETRSQSCHRAGMYAHEMTVEDHERLLAAIRELRGKVILSGYPSPLYETALGDWERTERKALADGARARTEVLWMNAAAADSHGLFQVTA